MIKVKLILSCFVLLMIAGCSGITPHPESDRMPAQITKPHSIDSVSFFSTPEDAHQTWLNAIQSAHHSILMEMFHLTDPAIVEALRAKPPQVTINLILDSGNLKSAGTETIKDNLIANKPNIHVFPSSGLPNGFSQIHTKAMVVDGKIALITSINLTNNASVQRDYGIQSKDPNIIAEMTKVFTADIQNSQNSIANLEPSRFTPDGVGQGNLIWSPVNSESRLVSLIEEAIQIPEGPQKYLNATVENLGNVAIENALSKAAENGVSVRLIVPECVLGANGPRNYSFFKTLPGVKYRVMPHPSSAEQPYMHGKMMMLGNGRAYVGSVNYSTNSTKANRELGIIFTSPKVSQQISALFEKDWSQSLDVPDASVLPTCPTTTTDPSQ